MKTPFMNTFIVIGIILQFSSTTGLAQNRRKAGEEPLTQDVTSIITPTVAPTSLSNLVSLAPIIVIGTCVTEMPGRYFVPGNTQSDVVTDRILQVDQVLKGQLPPQTQIAIEEFGGTLKSANLVVKHVVVLHQNPIQEMGRYLLFLRPSQQPVGDKFDGIRFTIVGVWAGSFQLVGGHVHLSDGDQPALRALDGASETAVTLAVKNAIGTGGR